MTIPNLPPFYLPGYPAQPLPDVVPFTSRSGATFAEVFYNYKHYIESELIPNINKNQEKLIATLNKMAEGALTAGVEVSAPIMAAVAADENSVFGAILRTMFAGKSVEATLQSAVENIKVIDTAVQAVTNDVNTRLSNNAIDNKIKAVAVTKNSQVVNVMDYAAIGDGVADDTTAIRNAIAAAGVRGTVTFPTGKIFLVKSDSPYSHGVKPLSGQRFEGNGAVIKAKADTPIGIRVIVVEQNNVTIDGLTIDQNGVDQSTGVYVTNSENAIVKNSRFPFPKSGALHIVSNVSNLLFNSNIVTGAGYGVLVGDPDNVTGIIISDSIFDGKGLAGDGIEFNVPTKRNVSTIVVANNIVRNYTKTADNANMGFGIAVAGTSQVSITGNTVKNCDRNGIHVEDASGRVTVSGNTVDTTGDAGIEVQPTPSGIGSVLITSNTVFNTCLNPTTNVPNLAKGGIQVGWNNAGVSNTSHVLVSNNIVSGSVFAGIYAYQAPNVQIIGNRCYDNGTYGIELWSTNGALLQGNRCYDTRTPKVQTHGLRIASGSGDKLLVVGNNFEGNLNTDGVSDVTTGAILAMNVGTLGKESVDISGGTRKLGFFGTAAISKPTGTPVAAVDTATTQALVNDIRAKLISLGLLS